MSLVIQYYRSRTAGNGGQLGSSGQLGDGSRQVQIRVTGSVNILATIGWTIEAAVQVIGTTLIAAGWDPNLKVISPDIITLPGTTHNFDVYANVDNVFSDDDIGSHLRNDLAGVMTITGVNKVNTAVGQINAGNASGAGGSGDPNASPAWVAFWQGLGLTAIPSIGIVTLVGGLALVLMLKK